MMHVLFVFFFPATRTGHAEKDYTMRERERVSNGRRTFAYTKGKEKEKASEDK